MKFSETREETRQGEEEDFSDFPGCFGSYSRHSKLCGRFCAVRIYCASELGRNEDRDILDRLLESARTVRTVQ